MIAISYRREDSTAVAGRIYDRLRKEFGQGKVFMDFDSIPYGVDFREHIQRTLKKADVLVAVIGPDWLGKGDKATTRIEDPADFVRLEIAGALQRNIPIIPVLINNTPMPQANVLPAEIEGLAFRNGLALDTGIDFHHHTDRLIAGIRRVLNKTEDQVVANADVGSGHRTRISRSVAITLVAVAGLICAGAGVAWFARSRQGALPNRLEISPAPRSSITPAPSPTPVASASIAASPAQSLATPVASASIAASPAQSPGMAETSGTHTYRGNVGRHLATFELHFESERRVTGSYRDESTGETYELKGENPPGRLLLDEYTHNQLTAHLDLSLTSSANEVRWEGTMYNVHPNTNTYSVSFTRSAVPRQQTPPPSAEASREFIIGRWQVEQTIEQVKGGTYVDYESDGTFSGTWQVFLNGQGVRQEFSGSWDFTKLAKDRFRLHLTSDNGTEWSQPFRIVDHDRIHNTEQNYDAVRVPR